jgi:phage regulator Rha-like protein
MSSFQNTQIALAVNQVTMSSRQIADLTNKEHKNVKRDCEIMFTELELDALSFERIYLDGMNRQQVEYSLDRELVQTLITGYNIKLRHAVVQRLNELESKQSIPQNFAQAMRLAADLYEQNERIALERDEAIRTKAQISDRKTATALNTASQATKKANKLQAELGRCTSNATIIAVEKLTGDKYAWMPLRKWCKAQGVKAIEVVDARYGLVKAWPSAAWSAVFGVDLDVLFNGETA